jgi:hypothetical protein
VGLALGVRDGEVVGSPIIACPSDKDYLVDQCVCAMYCLAVVSHY